MRKVFALTAGLLCALVGLGQPSVLRSGLWYKVEVDHDGIYKITYDQLKGMGFNVSKIDPRHIGVFGNPGGMLPQANVSPRPYDLIENAIQIVGENDGRFDKQDYILFYGEGPDAWQYDIASNRIQYDRNIYADHNYYFITVGEANAKRITTATNIEAAAVEVATYDAFIYHESEQLNILKSGRDWFGENFSLSADQTFDLSMSDATSGSDVIVNSTVMASAVETPTFSLFLNGVKVGDQVVATVKDPVYFPYAPKGEVRQSEFVLSSDDVGVTTTDKSQLRYSYHKTGTGLSTGYLDKFLVQYTRRLKWPGDQMIFSSAESLSESVSHYSISSVPNGLAIWDISEVGVPVSQSFNLSGNVANYYAASTALRTFIAFDGNLPAPKNVGTVPNQDLHSMPTPGLVIVTNPAFASEANRLAAHRAAHSGIAVQVVTTEQIYNEFSSGRQDVTAIRDLVKHLYAQNPALLKSVLMFGRGSYDYKDRLYSNTNFVPIYESRNSLSPLETYSSDDYFGFLQQTQGNWTEGDLADEDLMDIGVGRLAVKTIEEARVVVDKIIAYETNSLQGRWRKQIAFVADDGDDNLHQGQADGLATQIEDDHKEFNVKRIFLDAFPQELKTSGQFSPETRDAIENAIDQGTLVINYTGHGGSKIWAQEKIFDNVMIFNLKNKLLPFFVTATCDFGRMDDPEDISSAEYALVQPGGGAIGLVSTARPVKSDTNYDLNLAWYDAMFQRQDGQHLTVGEIFKRTKNNSVSNVSNRNFSLLGDPSMHLAMPAHNVAITQIMNDSGGDTLKALSTVTVAGEVQDDGGQRLAEFDGHLEATLYDKRTSFTTLGDENPPYGYKEWNSAIFRGRASITDGLFQFNFIVPKNIAYQIGSGKLSLYAANDATDASGGVENFSVGASSGNATVDNTSPVVAAFMGDESFVDGSTVTADAYLVATLFDAHGINMSGYGVGNSIIAMLDEDDSKVYVLNDYYETVEDDFTHGRLAFPVKNMTAGPHKLRVKAWDTYNNPGEATVHFNVSESSAIALSEFGSYPNPSQGTTTFFFKHNRPGDDLEGHLEIIDMTGQVVKSFDFNVQGSTFQTELSNIQLDRNGKNLGAGVYCARVSVRSLANNSKNERVTRVILLN